MENASKALIMAGGVLLGVLLISLAVYLFSSYAEYSSNAYERMEAAQIEQFNAQFLKYYDPAAEKNSTGSIKPNGTGSLKTKFVDANGNEYSKETPVLCTIHDIISLANLSKQNNKDMEIENQARL